ncbi:MAG: ArsR family transcriptional regulator [Candidatus Aenigmarchaeota archaeon]|nr:ArsR family transcriptional regulator [Candidatus Aenigmarchaeota archaeon]
MNWELYSFVVRSGRRKSIILSLKTPKTPTEISKDIKASTAHVSRSLKEFLNKGLVKCLTPNARAGRVYKLTEKGQELREELMRKEV